MKILYESIEEYVIRMKEFPSYINQPKTTLYHNTKLNNVESILKNGILMSSARYPEYEGDFIWVTGRPSRGYGGRTIAFDSTGYKLQDISGGDYRVMEDVKPEDILFVDFFVTETNRLSEVPSLIEKYGYDKVMKVIKNFSEKEKTDVNFEVIKSLVNRIK